MSCPSNAGVIVGSDASQEWLLPWWFSHFRKYNPDCLVSFADFGMSSNARDWCAERGLVQPISSVHDSPNATAEVFFQGDFWQEWKLNLSLFTSDRWFCFRKPLALFQSPFQRTLWLDLDCQIRGSLGPLLSMPLSSSGLGATPCGSYCHVNNLSKSKVFLMDKYNTGVVLVEKGSSLLQEWVSLSQKNIAFRTDEGSLSFLADRKQMAITEIPFHCNWPVHSWGENPEALIYHWLGKEAKVFLKSLVAQNGYTQF